MANYTFPELLGFAQNAGFSGQSANTAAAIALAESSGNAGAVTAEPNGTTSFGLMQINSVHPGAAGATDPQASFDQAYALSNGGQNFSPWTTYNNGAYAGFLPDGSAATDANATGSAPGGTTMRLMTNPTDTGGAAGASGGTGNSFLDNLFGLGGATSNPGTDAINQGGLGQMGGSNSTGTNQAAIDANGNPVGSGLSPLSSIFASIGNLFQRFGYILLGIILVGIGAYFLARPQFNAVVSKAGKVAAAA